MSSIFVLPRAHPITTSGATYSGAKAEFFLTGTSTGSATYSDAALTSANANPVVADSAGQFGIIYLDEAISYKMTLSESDDTLIYTEDPVEQTTGGIFNSAVSKTTSYTIVAADNGKLFYEGDTSNVDYTLPDATTVGTNFRVAIMAKSGSFSDATSITRAGSDTITLDGSGTVTSFELNQGGFAVLVSDGSSNWVTSATGIQGSFTATITGTDEALTGTMYYRKTAMMVDLWLSLVIEATSNATTMTMTGIPAAIQPAQPVIGTSLTTDNGGLVLGHYTITAGTATFGLAVTGSGGYTASGEKGLPASWNIRYPAS